MTAIGVGLATVWGAFVLGGGVRLAGRAGVSERARALRSSDGGSTNGWAPRTWWFGAGRDRVRRLGLLGRMTDVWLDHRARRRRDDRIARELPAAVDLLAVVVSAGATPFDAVATASAWSPPTIAEAFRAVLTACRLGASFEAALADAAHRDPRLGPVARVLGTGTRLGAAVADALERLAGESRRELRRRAETRARTVPVRLLFPLVFLVLPAFGLLTVVPAVVAGFHGL